MSQLFTKYMYMCMEWSYLIQTQGSVSLLSFANLGGFGKKIGLIVLKWCAVASDQEWSQGQFWYWLKKEQLHVGVMHSHLLCQ